MADDLMDVDHLLHCRQIDDPGLCSRLYEELRRQSSSEFEPAGKSIRKGNYKLYPERNRSAALTELVDLIRVETEHFVAEANGEHPWFDLRPDVLDIRVWANFLKEGGHLVAHIHPNGWMTGVFYVDAPEGTAAIELGPSPHSMTHRIQPQTGMLLMFPSFFFHRTEPNLSSEPRVSIAFDLV